MKFQPAPGYCAPAAVANALRCLGINARVDIVAQYCGTTEKHGTTEHGIKQALERYNMTWVEVSTPTFKDARRAVLEHLALGFPAIVLVEGGSHWTTVIGQLGTQLIIFDSQNSIWNRAENGVRLVDTGPRSFSRYWDPYDKKRYALLIKPETT